MKLCRVSRVSNELEAGCWNLQIVESRCDVSHQAHQEERKLEDRMLDELQAVNQVIIPSGTFHVHNEAEKPYQDTNA
jgi:hypothetical protein